MTWYSKNKEKASQSNRKWREENKEYDKLRKRKWYTEVGRERDLMKKYGITKDEWVIILKSQDGHCALCPSTHNLNLDHNHSTNVVRGILCYDCNRNFIGSHEDPEKFRRAAEYLQHGWIDGVKI